MRDPILQDKMVRERERFANSIDPDAVCRLASSFYDGHPCKLFQPFTHGSFNVCFFVEFDLPQPASSDAPTEPVRWVVRIPISARVPWVDEKIEVEIATMRYVASKTVIPVPRVHAWSTATDSPIHEAYIIMDYVEGKTLSRLGFPGGYRWKTKGLYRGKALDLVYEQLVDVYIQLRSLVLPAVGALGFAAKTPSTSPKPTKLSCTGEGCLKPSDLQSTDVSNITLCNRPMPVELVMQEVEGRDPTTAFPLKQTFKTSSEYSNALLWLAENEVDKARDIWLETRNADQVVYGSHDFKRYVNEEWLDRDHEDGPFVLMHGDLSFHGSNLLWDKDYKLVAVLDWEWSHAVPVQYFVPPLWLNGFHGLSGLAGRTAPKISGFGPESKERLAKHWDIMRGRMAEFFKASPAAEAFMARKEKEQEQFEEEWEKYQEEMADEAEDCQCLSCKQKRAQPASPEDTGRDDDTDGSSDDTTGDEDTDET